MKKLFVMALTIFTMVSCADDIEFNTPAMQGKKDGSSWKAVIYSGYINENDKAIISGSNNYEVINLQVSSFSEGTYLLGENSQNEAVLIDANDRVYSTLNLPDQEAELYPPDGIIEITDYNQDRHTISGKFWFNAYSESGSKTVNFSQGVFYEIPVPVNSGPVLMSCDDAVAASTAAENVYLATDPADSTYPTVCNNYKNALMDQQVACGDDLGTIQATIDSLVCE